MTTKTVTLISMMGDTRLIGCGTLDEEGRLIHHAGVFLPGTDPDHRDKELRQQVVKVIEDEGEGYKRALRGLALPPTYHPGD